MSTKSQGALQRLLANRTVAVLVLMIVVGFIGAGVNTVIVLRDTANSQDNLELSGTMRLTAQQVAASAREANSGNASAFAELAQARSAFDNARSQLTENRALLPVAAVTDLEGINALWNGVNDAAQAVVASRDNILFLAELANSLQTLLPRLQQQYAELVDAMIAGGAGADQVALAERQIWLAERISRNMDRLLTAAPQADQAVAQLSSDISRFSTVLTGLQQGNASEGVKRVTGRGQTVLNELVDSYTGVGEAMAQAQTVANELLVSVQAAAAIAVDVPVIMQLSSSIASKLTAQQSERPLSVLTALLFVGLILVALGLLGWQSIANAQQRLRETALANERNQTAILRLLDELADLADGDLTTSATVTEDFTGAIADSINYTIDQLRVLVSQINDTAVSVSSAAQASQSTALNLAQASESQAKEIAGASAAVTEMAASIDKVSANARDSATVAQRSVGIANSGAEVVQNTIKGMDNIREQIQETSKRIKRLGESTQEIGDIVSLINDIADQTNILALNAAIQASMAGDAGRGFAVVADEVQRLAERSSGATKQIEALVKTIQSDTNEAVASMEQTTSEVVRGARLAQDAGSALTEIRSVSQELAELIQNISSVAGNQASSASQISSTMQIIREITSQTSSGSTETARSIGALAEMTNDLRNSVAGFTLPERGA